VADLLEGRTPAEQGELDRTLPRTPPTP